jgi:hypothetical protein
VLLAASRGAADFFQAVFRNHRRHRNEDLDAGAFFALCDVLCGAELERELENYVAIQSRESQLKLQLVQSPTTQRIMNDVDDQFASCFSITIMERYCAPDKMLSKRLETNRNAFFGRNPTKYIHHRLVLSS